MRLSPLCLLGFLAVASAAPQHLNLNARQTNATNTTSACASVSAAVAGASRTVVPQVPAKLAHDCLTSIPLNASSAASLVDSLRPYVEWQSTLAYLKDPPAEYAEKVQAAVDILGGLDGIKADVAAGKFASEYEFGFALYTLFQSAHDGHFTFVPDSVGVFFSFGRPLALVSVADSQDQLPAVFEYSDIVGLHFKNISYTPSAIALIDDEDVAVHLEKLSQSGSLQDRDALYNNMFYNLAQISLGSSGAGTGMFSGGGRGRFVYPGPTTTLTFVNGSTRTVENFARVSISFSGIQSGEDLAERYLYYGSSAAVVGAASVDQEQDEARPGSDSNPVFENVNINTVQKRAEKRQTSQGPPPGYPQPLLQARTNVISAYFLEGEGYEDVAVLAVPSFVSIDTLEQEFQYVGDELIRQAKAAGKTKLIIDVSANGGGTILQGYDLFKKLFPSMLPYGASRFRATPDLDKIGQAFSDFAVTKPRSVTERNGTVLNVVASYFNFQTDVDDSYQNFQSWPDKFGPATFHGDNFTSLARWNLSDVLIPLSSGGIEISGYGNRSNVTDQPFEASNVLIVYDGYCASTCTIFSEFMRQQAGVKALALGGRPNLNPIQAVGGVKGTNNFPWSSLQNFAQLAVSLGADRTAFEGYYQDLPFARSASGAGVNVRNGYRQNDTEQTPLQFVYETADCKLWYTPDMIVDASAIWRAAADATWNNKIKCVGSGTRPGYKREVERTTKLSKRGIAQSGGISYEALMESLNTYTDLSGLEFNANGFMAP